MLAHINMGPRGLLDASFTISAHSLRDEYWTPLAAELCIVLRLAHVSAGITFPPRLLPG